MTYTPPWMRLCDCRCPLHHGLRRTTYHDQGCACAITCATQPITLIAEPWGCALFLDPFADFLWTVTKLQGGQWDWDNAGEIDSRSDFVGAGLAIEDQLREVAGILHAAIR
jgi:hypothetical protein